MTYRTDRDGLRSSRRHWLQGALLLGLGQALRVEGADTPSAKVELALAPIYARAKAAGLRGFRASTTEHYVGVGDARDAYRRQALDICESLSKVYQGVFGEKGFPVEFPDRRLTVVTLKNRASYAAYLGEAPGKDVGGHYDLDTNQLVMFDYAGDPDEAQGADTGRINEFILVHEALHQLTFNTGMLDSHGDIPRAVSEGLAMYGEAWRHNNKRATSFGRPNEERLKVFRNVGDADVDWFPLDRLLADDALFDGADAQVAYAESWAFVHYFIKTSSRLPRFRDYLKALTGKGSPKRRVEEARKHLGDLAVLDRALKKYARSMLSKVRG